MGGTQSWLNCGDATYPAADSDLPTPPVHGDRLESGDPIIAVFMLIGTLAGVLLLTAAVHCGIVACRGWRRYWRHRQHHRRHKHHLGAAGLEAAHSSKAGGVGGRASFSAAVGAGVNVEEVGGDADGSNDVDGESSLSSSTSTMSSDTSMDSTTARIAAQVASRRRSQFIIELAATGSGGVAVGGAASRSPTPTPSLSRQQTAAGVVGGGGGGGSGGGGDFLRPPTGAGAGPPAYVNRAYDSRLDV